MNALKSLRVEHGITQSKAAKLVYVDLRTMARYEAVANPPLRVIELLRYKLMDESVSRGNQK